MTPSQKGTLFVQSVTPAFDIYNTFLQSEEPLVHLLQESTLNLYKALLVRFIKSHIIAQNDDILSTDTEDSTDYKESSSVHIGYSTMQYALSKDFVETSNYAKFLKEVHEFYVKTFSYLLKSTPFLRDSTLKCLSVFLKPAERVNIKEDHLTLPTTRFPLAIFKDNAGKLQEELLDYQTANETELPKENDENNKCRKIDQYWFEITLMKEVATQIPRFPNLSNLARFLLLIPHSNSFCECVFSTAKKIPTDSRHNLGKDVVGGQAHSSVYESETGI